MNKVLFMLAFQFCFLSAYAGKLQLSAHTGMWAFTTQNISATEESESGFGAYNVQLAYGFAEKFSVATGINILMSDGFGGSQGFGVDVGVNYYPFTASTSQLLQTEAVQLARSESWRPYVGLHLRQRTFNLALSTSFFGPGLSVGVDYQYSETWFLNAEIRYDQLMGADEAEATQTNILLGAGFEF